MNKRMLVISAHPDDMELECGGTIAKFVNKGYDVHHLILTSKYVDKASNSSLQRQNEAYEAAEILGIKDVLFFEYSDSNLPLDGNIISKVDNLIDDLKPDILISHHPFDSHQDHKVAAEIMFAVSRQGRVSNVLSGSPLPYRPNIFAFKPQVFIDITETIDFKLNSIKAYKSQFEKYGGELLIDRLKAMAKYYGWAIGCEYAECFEVIRMDDSLW